MCNTDRTGKRRVWSADALVRVLLPVLTAIAFSCPSPTSAQTNNSSQAFPSNRYLFIVETSRTMQRRAEGTLRAVKDLLGSAMHGQMHPGDSLGVWTFNESLYTGRLPLQEWSINSQGAIAETVLDFIQGQRYEKHGLLEKVLAPMLRVVKSSEFITVILITEGTGVIQGTPYDAEISQSFKAWAAQQQEAKMPIVTVLRAQGGHITAFTVTPVPWPVEIPPLPAQLKIARAAPRKPAVTAVKAPHPVVPPLIVTGKKSQPPPPPNAADLPTTNAQSTIALPRPEGALSGTLEVVSNEVAATNGLALTNNSPATLAQNEKPADRAAEPAARSQAAIEIRHYRNESHPTPALSPVPTATPEPVVTKPNPAQNPSEVQSSLTEPLASSTSESVSTDQVPATLPQPPIAATAANGSHFSAATITIYGVLCFMAGCAVVWFRKRRSRPAGHVSLITRSFEKEQ